MTLEEGDPGHHPAEHQALDDAIDDVLAEINLVLHLAPEGALVHPQQTDADEPAADDPHGAEQGGEEGHGYQTAKKARGEDALDGIDGHHLQAGKLFGGLHQADLGGQGRAGAARHEQGGDHGAEFAHQGGGDHDPQALGGAKLGQDVVALEA